ncbi:uncharacterized protein LOC134131237 [Pungitius pungitius]|uniref:uncharacterized protein LOC134131237 n=1 Tax=Pungitius pungitius TaxID=134920 RepID=UPI002E0E9D8C
MAYRGPDVTEYLTRIQMEPSELQLRLAQQEERIEELCQLLRQSATPAVQPAIPSASTGPAPMAMPGKYDGSPGKCLGFLMQCGMYIAHHSANYQTEKDRVDFVISLLTGRALDWATALWSAGAPELLSEQHFQAQFKEVFDHPITGKTTGDLLCEIRQGSQTVSDYALRFRTLAAGSGWSETALLTIYRRGLRPELQAELACRGDVTQLGDYIRVSISVGHLLESRRSPRASFPSEPTFPVTPPLADEGPEPMQLGRLPLSPAERIRRIREQLCLYCGEAGHLLRNCRLRPPRQKDGWTYTSAKVGLSPVLNMSRQQLTLPTVLSLGKMKQEVRGLVDSGAAGNFMDQHLAHRLAVPLIPVRPPLRINALDGQPLGTGMIMHQTANITLRVGALHEEDIRFFIVSSPREPLILGHPWLVLHDPVISWRQGELLTWSPECMSRCLNVTCRATSVEAATATKTQAVPPCYETLQEVFSKQKAAELAPHRPCDCAIELLPEGPLPRGRIYALSLPEEEAMNQYVEESLQQGIIRPSTSPAASSFFFVGKKDGGLRPCIDYRALNAITVKNRFPLPLIPAALEQVGGASIYTKLDLRSAYNLVRIREGDEWKTAFLTARGHYEYLVMPYGLTNAPAVFQAFMNELFHDMINRFLIVYIDDLLIYSHSMEEHVQQVRLVLQRLQANQLYVNAEKSLFHVSTLTFLGYVLSPGGVAMDQGKVDAVHNWPTPNTVKELQRFLGFSNYYRRFIRNFGAMAAPLTALTSQKKGKLPWSDAAQKAFDTLKLAFTSAPVLTQPDPDRQFIVEVDASEEGVGGVLSQRTGSPPKVHPCAFFSKKLSPAERNYDVGNRELLAIKLALEEWRHWLEGARHPFMVLTDHRNLEYLKGARRLNPRQARWALFFTRFQFTVSYQPGEKNAKADALSRLYGSPASMGDPEPILPDSYFVGPIHWELESVIQDALRTDPAPPDTPANRVYVPASVRPQLVQWSHTSLGSGHPGITRTTQLLSQKYWWNSLASDVRDYVLSCPVCAQTKTPRQLPAGELVPLPTPQRPWSHVAVDFLTDLPASEGFTTILVLVDRFSKMCRFIPLCNLPSAIEMAECLFLQVFRPFGLPEEIISDRGPQFTSQVWRAFCNRLGIKVKLTSGYHPETNGQTERLNQELGKYLRGYCLQHPHDWSRYVAWAEYAQNSTFHSSLRLTPFQCVLGYQPPLFPWDTRPGPVPAVEDWFQRSGEVWETAHRHLCQAASTQKKFADRRRRPAPSYQTGQRVWLSTRNLKLRLPCRKLWPRYIGPFKITHRINPVTYRLLLPKHYRISSAFHVSLLKPVHASPLHPSLPTPTPPAPLEIDGGPAYAITAVLDSKRLRDGLHYLVDWEGYGPEKRSWIPARDVLSQELIEEFHRMRPDRPAPRPRGRPPSTVARPSGAGRGGGGSVGSSDLESEFASRVNSLQNTSPVFKWNHRSSNVCLPSRRNGLRSYASSYASPPHRRSNPPFLLLANDPSWRQGELLTWSPECLSRCLNVTCRATSVEAATAPKTQAVPSCYETLQEVFSKQKAAELAPHRPCNCAIELLPEGPLLRGRIYALSLPEEEAMNRFFFVGKKDGGLRPCIDDRALNAITVMNRFPLPLIPAALEQERAAMDQDEVRNWPTPKTVKDLQRFLGFSNYYRRFIRNFGAMAAPLTALTSQKKGKLPWSDAAWKAFDTLKRTFTSAPVLTQPYPDHQFIVEVDASEEGVGDVLFQHTGSPPKMHPCAFFSKKLSLAERNYDVGNRELLAIKLALEEWRHWLEGARHPFMVLTDHRNLEYLKGAKRLNPRQARWALCFTRFQFTVSYQPGEKNAEVDVLSRVYGSPASMTDLEPILPDSYFVVRPQLVQWSHTTLGSGHPGITRTTQLLSQKFGWNSLASDVRDYVLSCPVCAQTKTPRQLPAGELVPLPTPQRPWSHVAVDFLTDLPASEEFTTILVLVDRFSKMCRFILLCNLPSAMEMAECLFLQVFRPYGLPEEIISNRGPQFTSHVWRAFCNRLGIKVKLTSGYHPETNGQTERLNQELGKYLLLS